MNYLNMLMKGYDDYIKYQDPEYPSSKLEYIGNTIFNYTTYENLVMEKITCKTLEVCNAISTRTTFEYINTDEGNEWYLIMVNMPFFNGKLNWGGSIRGAW